MCPAYVVIYLVYVLLVPDGIKDRDKQTETFTKPSMKQTDEQQNSRTAEYPAHTNKTE